MSNKVNSSEEGGGVRIDYALINNAYKENPRKQIAYLVSAFRNLRCIFLNSLDAEMTANDTPH